MNSSKLTRSNSKSFYYVNPKKAGGGAPRAPPNRLSSTISSLLKVACSYLVTFHFKPSNKSWKSHFWNFFHQLQKNCCWSQLVSIIFDQKTEKINFFHFFFNKSYFFCPKLNSTWKMHSFDVFIVDIAQKLQNLKIFTIFWSNCTITVILKFFSAFRKKKFLMFEIYYMVLKNPRAPLFFISCNQTLSQSSGYLDI